MFASQNKLLSAKSASWRVDKKNEFVVFLYFVAYIAMCMLWIDSPYIHELIGIGIQLAIANNQSIATNICSQAVALIGFVFLRNAHKHSLASNYIGSIALLRAIISTRNLRSLSPIMIKLDDLLHNLLESFTNWIARGWLGFVFNIHFFVFAIAAHFSNISNCFLIHLAKIQLDFAINSSLAWICLQHNSIEQRIQLSFSICWMKPVRALHSMCTVWEISFFYSI